MLGKRSADDSFSVPSGKGGKFTSAADGHTAAAVAAAGGGLLPAKTDFGAPPPGYRAGVGRGMAVQGFEGAGLDGGGRRNRMGWVSKQQEAAVAAAQQQAQAIAGSSNADDDGDRGDYSDSQFDSFSGYAGSWFGDTPYEQDDREADEVWDAIDRHRDSRRRERREAAEKAELAKLRKERPKVSAMFSGLKEKLATVSADEWANVPEIGDQSLRYKRKEQRYTPAPDSLLAQARQENAKFSSIEAGATSSANAGAAASGSSGSALSSAAETARRMGVVPAGQSRAGISGLQTPAGLQTPSMVGGMQTPLVDLNQVGEARKTVLSLKLNEASDSVSGQTNVDPKGMLTDLNSLRVTSAAEVGDIKKARLLLKSVVSSNPTHAPGWIAYARLEEVAGKLAAARKLAAQGCEQVPGNEDIWLESARLNSPAAAKAILAQAVQRLPQSVKLWEAAAELEEESLAKKLVLRKALEFVPKSVRLWKAAVAQEEPDDARILLARAVECVPHSVDIWLALARLESYQNARKVLNEARKKLPTEPAIWITAAKLEEANGNTKSVGMVIRRAVRSLAQHQVTLERDQWMTEAQKAEEAGAVATAQAIVAETVGQGLEEEDRMQAWLEDADGCVARGAMACARAVYAHALSVYTSDKTLWLRAAALERAHGSRESLDALLTRAVEACPEAESLWLMAAKEKAVSGDVDGARATLSRAFAQAPDSEHIWLAAVKLERDNQELARARSLLERARQRADTERVWMKSVLLERDAGQSERESSLLSEALARFPRAAKLWLMAAQAAERSQDFTAARQAYARGLRNCPKAVALWISAVRLEVRRSSFAKARAFLEKARVQNPSNEDLWLEAIRTERRAGNGRVAEQLLAKALQECPTSGRLWSDAILSAPKPAQKAKSVDALKRCDNDVHVVLAVAKLFWLERRVEKARTWLRRAAKLSPLLGDAWANAYKFEVQYGTVDQQRDVLRGATAAEPRYGETWVRVSKDWQRPPASIEEAVKRTALLLDTDPVVIDQKKQK